MDEAEIKEFFVEYEARFNWSLQDPPVVDVEGWSLPLLRFLLEPALGVSVDKLLK
jgi:hypothetical protein